MTVASFVQRMCNAEFEEIGYFDIFLSSDSNEFHGTWSNYLYYPSGNVVVSGIEQGLFVLNWEIPVLMISPAPSVKEPSSEPSSSPVPSLSPSLCVGDTITVTINTDFWAQRHAILSLILVVAHLCSKQVRSLFYSNFLLMWMNSVILLEQSTNFPLLIPSVTEYAVHGEMDHMK